MKLNELLNNHSSKPKPLLNSNVDMDFDLPAKPDGFTQAFVLNESLAFIV